MRTRYFILVLLSCLLTACQSSAPETEETSQEGETVGDTESSVDASAGSDVSSNNSSNSSSGSSSNESPEVTLELLTAQLADQKDLVLRAKAETDNMRRRASRDVEKAHKFAVEKFANSLLPVVVAKKSQLGCNFLATTICGSYLVVFFEVPIYKPFGADA